MILASSMVCRLNRAKLKIERGGSEGSVCGGSMLLSVEGFLGSGAEAAPLRPFVIWDGVRRLHSGVLRVSMSSAFEPSSP